MFLTEDLHQGKLLKLVIMLLHFHTFCMQELRKTIKIPIKIYLKDYHNR